MKLLKLIVPVGVIILLAACSSTDEIQKKTFLLWNPNIAGSIEQLKEIQKTQKVRQEIADTGENIAYLYDAELYVVVHSYLNFIPTDEKANAIEVLSIELIDRKNETELAYQNSNNKYQAAFNAQNKYISVTQALIAKYEKILESRK